jgi:His/Glu/Gln/Arg/opine family amino acid ABC transporter permease subunit
MSWLTPILSDIGVLAKPALFNLYFAVASIPAGFVLAVLLALAKASPVKPLAAFARGYIYAFRGSPFFIQLFMFYSVALALNLSVWKPLGIDGFVLHPLFLGPLILTLNTAAYAGEIFHGALRTVPRGEVEAARAYGMSRTQQFRHVIWPHLIRIAWPAYTNEVVFLFHATALVYFTLPVIDEQKDLMNKAGELFERDYNAFLHFSVAALYFLAISLAIFIVFGLIYRRLTRHLPEPPRLRFTSRWLG